MFKIFFILFIEYILLFTFTISSFAIQFDDPSLWHDTRISEFLENSKMLDIKPMKDALNEMGKITEFDGKVYLITLENNIKAVFKVLPSNDQGDAEAEVASYTNHRL